MEEEPKQEFEEIVEDISSLDSLELPKLLAKSESISGVVIGYVEKIDSVSEEARVFVNYPGNIVGDALEARSIPSDPLSEGDEIAIMFEGGDPTKPLIVGPIQNPKVSVEIDSEKPEMIDLGATDRITLRCGKASITLTKEGKILLRGAYVSSRSTGVNKIKGGSVQIN